MDSYTIANDFDKENPQTQRSHFCLPVSDLVFKAIDKIGFGEVLISYDSEEITASLVYKRGEGKRCIYNTQTLWEYEYGK